MSETAPSSVPTDSSSVPERAPERTVPVLDEIIDNHENTLKYIGQCKWFSDKLGYGFLTICDGDKKGMDIFSHHSGIKPLNSNYKTLKKGEYVEFNIVNGLNGLQAVNVTGINGGALMCDFVTSRKLPGDGSESQPLLEKQDEEWQQVQTRKPRMAVPGQSTTPRKKFTPNKYNKNATQ